MHYSVKILAEKSFLTEQEVWAISEGERSPKRFRLTRAVWAAARLTCQRGHVLEADAPIRRDGTRECRICNSSNRRLNKARKLKREAAKVRPPSDYEDFVASVAQHGSADPDDDPPILTP